MGTLVVTGFLRGENLDVNRLIHIPNLGDFQVEKIEGPVDPHRRHTPLEIDPIVLASSSPELQVTFSVSLIKGFT